ncbi:MAG: Asp-tRNA(Asn)/Glu-tRNA(Gln) amidotransferase subunit GatB [Parcubacteria group bacterium]|nr:MAG: Asp-tRNA(Asn)/Glu-tRNA(Gln) amidotransferase subunit GatB [Parcubacteria group bacterium]
MGKYETIIGLEIHLQLKTKSKMFCACANRDNQAPNSLVCPICLGHPGTLPTVNQAAVHQGLAMALALNCKINQRSKFDRKNYFYPDLAKGYQISQFDEPLAGEGHLILNIDSRRKRFGIERLHLEEDAAKNIHRGGNTLTDFNRGGAPLAEIVTRPDFRTPSEAKEFLQELRLIARYLGVSDADMEKGQLRCDANISLRPQGQAKLYPKIEIKNLNSFRSVERALIFEIDRQSKLWDQKKAPKITETRGWDENKGVTVLQRTKEGSSDYRYFPEPDLPPLIISKELLTEIKAKQTELPQAKAERFVREYQLNYKDARVLINQKEWAGYFEEVMSELQAWLLAERKVAQDSPAADKLWAEHREKLAKLAYNWISTEIFALIKGDFDYKNFKISAENMAEFLSLIYLKKINSSAGRTIVREMFKGVDDDPSHIAEDLKLLQEDDQATLSDFVIKIIMSYPEQVRAYQSGKEALLKFFIGKVMAESRGQANPQIVERLLKEKLKK